MRTKIDWPSTLYAMSGMDTFCGGPSHEDRTANSYYREVKPMVDRIVHNLEQEIDHLNFVIEDLKKQLKASKPKVRYNQGSGVWELVQAQCGWKPDMAKEEA